MKNNRGITLVALVITIIILLILAGIAIVQLTDSGLFGKMQLAKEKQDTAEVLERERLTGYEGSINEYLNGDRGNFKQTVSTLLTETSCTLSSQDSWSSSTPKESHTLTDDIDNYDSIAIIMKHRPTSHTETNSMVRYVNPKIESGLITAFGASSDDNTGYYSSVFYSLKDNKFNIYRRWYGNYADLSFTIYGIKYN